MKNLPWRRCARVPIGSIPKIRSLSIEHRHYLPNQHLTDASTDLYDTAPNDLSNLGHGCITSPPTSQQRVLLTTACNRFQVHVNAIDS
jgi:hypothetical protein